MGVTLFDQPSDEIVFDTNFWHWRAIVEAVRSLAVLPPETLDTLHEPIAPQPSNIGTTVPIVTTSRRSPIAAPPAPGSASRDPISRLTHSVSMMQRSLLLLLALAACGGGTTATPDGAVPDTAPGTPTTEVAPYFYTWGWGSASYAFPSLAAMKQLGGPDDVTIAFVLSGGGCVATHDVQDNLDDVNAFVAAGGHVKASFGGADGTYLESACNDAPSLAQAIEDWVTATGVTDLDFDIEQGSTTSNPTINAMRASALAQVQAAQHVKVAFTLPVAPDGLDDLGKAVVQSALDAGVTISYVNVMTMDYGDASADLGPIAIGSATATAQQLVQMIPGLALADAYRMVGVTPMIGTNDDGSTFTLANASAVATFAAQQHLGLLAFWAIQRDEPCANGPNLDQCSGVNDATFQFASAFGNP